MIHAYEPYVIELLFDFFHELNIKLNKKCSREEKKAVLKVVETMLTQKVIYACSNDNKLDGALRKWNLSDTEIVNKIDEIWFEGAKFPNFYDMVWFEYQDWYIKALEKKGFVNNITNWESFVKNKIGNLEKWIEENKPKE